MAAILKFPTQPRDYTSGYIDGLQDAGKSVARELFFSGLAIGVGLALIVVTVVLVLR